MLLNPAQILGHQAFGPVARVLGLPVGYGSNFLNIIEAEGRLLLHNGYHRAYALREAGLTHAACIVQSVSRRDEWRAGPICRVTAGGCMPTSCSTCWKLKRASVRSAFARHLPVTRS